MILYKTQIYSMFVVLTLLSVCVFGIKEKGKENKIYNLVLATSFINLVFDIWSNYTVNNLQTVPAWLNRFTHVWFFVSMGTIFYFLYKYLVTLVEIEIKRPLKGQILAFFPYFLMVILDIFLPIYYKEEPTGNYSYGPGPVVLYICVFFYIALIISLIIIHRKNISKRNRTAVILAIASLMAASLFQFFAPATLTSSIGIGLLCLWLYMTVANPDVVMVNLLKEETAKADAANNAKSMFLAQISHEIRTPINAILGMNEIVIRESKEESIRRHARDIKSSTNALLSLINDILDSTKIESGKMEISPDNYEMANVFNDIKNMTEFRIKDKNLELIFDIDEEAPSMYYGDDLRIRQILMNLLTNAIKYTAEGSITLSFRTTVLEKDAILFFSVKDTGCGIKDEDVSRLFERFERFDRKKNRYIEGTGLGMSIVFHLLSLMDSELKVNTVYGEGTEFYFELVQPVVDMEPIGNFHEKIEQTENELDHTCSYKAKDARILVVDDIEINRRVVKGLLHNTEIQIDEASGGYECIERMSIVHYDIVFLDSMMPDLNGVDVLKLLQEKNLCKDTVMIMLTADAIVGAKEHYLGVGFDDYLSKPVRPEKLDKMIFDYLPPELVEMIPEDELEDATEAEDACNLPELDEFDFEIAMRNLGNKELLMKVLQDLYYFLGRIPLKINGWYEKIDEEESRVLYCTEVHALKSSAAMVGAILLSKTARLVECASKEGNVEKIRVLHPILLEEMEKHRNRIAKILPKDKVKSVNASKRVVLPFFELLINHLQLFEYAEADKMYAKIRTYLNSEEIENLLDELEIHILNMEDDEAIFTIRNIMEKLE